ncbi:MAG: LysM peptidoglycan-binding domain-containing protein [Bdellovibrio bacteriovorus]
MRAPYSSSPTLPVLLLAALTAFAPGALAATLKADAPDTYVVQPGDTLWSIAGRYLEDPWRWREVWRGSSASNPDLIFPGDVLRLSMRDGQPSIGVDGEGERETGGRGGIRVVKLSPRVRVTALQEAIPTIPIASIAPFLTQPVVAETDKVRRAPYVVGFPEERIVAGVGDSVYVRRIDDTRSQRFQILRPGDSLEDPETNETLGHLAVFVASAELERTGDPAKLRILRSERETAIGDRVIPAAIEEPLTNFYPRPAPTGMRGRIIAVLNGVSQIGQYDVVVLNKGTKDGVERGSVFEVFQGGGKERDQVLTGGSDFNWRDESPLSTEFWYGANAKLFRWRSDPFPPAVEVRYPRGTYVKPYERSGALMVFRTFDRVSFALVLDATRAMRTEDRIAAPRY